MANKDKIREVKERFSGLYCFTTEETEKFLAEAEKLPDEGLDKLILMLADGKKQQDEFLANRVEENKEYSKDLSLHLKKTIDEIKAAYESIEQSQAESILKDI